jgi:excisionase family DNA binding protein
MEWFFNVREAARYLRAIGARKATVSLVRRLIQSGKLRRIRVGRAFYVKKESLDAWFRKSLKQPRKTAHK